MSLVAIIGAFFLAIQGQVPLWVLHERVSDDAGMQHVLIEDVYQDTLYVVILEGDTIHNYWAVGSADTDCALDPPPSDA